MAIAYDNVSNQPFAVNGFYDPPDYTITKAHTTAAGNNLLIVAVHWCSTYGNTASSGVLSISSVTYNGTSLTHYNTYSLGINNIEIYYLANASTGSNNVVVTISSDDGNFAMTGLVSIISFTGVDQTTPLTNGDGNTGLNSPITNTLAMTVGNIAVDFTTSILSTTIAVSGGNTQRINVTNGTLGSVRRYGCSTLVADATPETLSWTEGTTTRDWLEFVLQVNAASDSVGQVIMIYDIE